ncbi:MAG: outer membrane lipid asymmetry maintenance protein MlaD [Gemmatimonadaceae bacterium]|nr:outer membrane lipid asymmetry maintenance protein MlaD [Acetobacteraceae bacterium]
MAGPKRSVAEFAAGAAVLIATAGFMAYAAANTGRGIGSGTTLSARFDNVGAIGSGADVRIGGVKVGSVVGTSIDAKSFQAVVRFTVQPDIRLPDDSSATISTGGLLGGSFLSLTPGGTDKILGEGGVITITQSASNLEDLLGKFIFNVGSLADATQKTLDQNQARPPP